MMTIASAPDENNKISLDYDELHQLDGTCPNFGSAVMSGNTGRVIQV